MSWIRIKWIVVCLSMAGVSVPAFARADDAAPGYHSPVDLVLGGDGAWLVTANETAGTASLVLTADGKLLDEAAVGNRPTAVTLCPDGRRVLVSASYSGEVTLLEVVDERLEARWTVRTGFEPRGIAVAPDGRLAYVALSAAHRVAVIDLEKGVVTSQFEVGSWPRHLAITPDGTRLIVATIGDGGVAVVDLGSERVLYQEKFKGLNLGHMRVSPSGEFVYFPSMYYGDNPSTPGNIRRGWVLGSRLARIGIDGPGRRNAMTLDVRGKAVGDPYGFDITPDGERTVIAAGGTHELLVLAADGLPFIGIGGSEHVDAKLLADQDRFARIPVGGRPMGLQIAADNRTVYVADFLEDAVKVVDLDQRQVVRTISLSDRAAAEPTLARRGEAIFFDAQRSLEGWFSCHSCHQDGGSNIEIVDTLNDGSTFTYKSILPLHHLDQTGPWTWHGWQDDLRAAMQKSLTSTMHGPAPTEADIDALIAFNRALELPPNPHLQEDGSLSESAQRGKAVFHSTQAGCADCHRGPYFTDGEIHDVGLGSSEDRYQGFNTPSLLGVYRKTRLLHHGRARSLEELLTDFHAPENVTGAGKLTNDARRDLIEYLKSL